MPAPHPRPRPRPRPRRRTARNQRSPWPLIVVLALTVTVAVALLWPNENSASPPESQGAPATAQQSVKKKAARKPIEHVTFGAHQRATQACATCHDSKSGEAIACNDCHKGACGKSAKTAADCVECHKTGVTDRW